MASEPNYYLLLLALPDAANMPAVALTATFDESVILGAELTLFDVVGNSHGNAIATLLSFGTPAGVAGGAIGYISPSTMSLSGTLCTSASLPTDITLDVVDPVTGNVDTAATLPANTTNCVNISWTAPSGTVQPRTRTEITSYCRERFKKRA